MSFGFSIGDFLTAVSLIRDIVSSLRNSSTSSYHELVLELHGLERALHEIEHLKCTPDQEAAVNGIKVAALMCQHPLDEFARKLNKFGSLGIDNGGKLGKRDMIKMWGRKMQWGFSMEEEATKLRAYLAAHVGSLNMRLIMQGLTSTTLAAQKAGEDHMDLKSRIAKSHTAVSETGRNVDKYGTVAVSNNWILKRLSSIVSGEITSQLKTLVDLANKVWQSNLQIMTFIVKLQTTPPSPELRYTWVQEPVKLEDALGRVIPIPSEYSWSKLEAVILEQFSTGPGSDKVSSGEYELFNTLDSSQILSKSEVECLTPGMSITMAMIVGKYGKRALDRCPRVGCKSMKITPNEAGGWICCVCKAWFDDAQKSLPRPLRPIYLDLSPSSGFKYVRHRGMKHRDIELHSDSILPTALQLDDVYKQLRLERRGYKNVHVHFAELPETPSVSNVRDHKQTSQRKKRHQKFTSSSPSKRPAMSPMANKTSLASMLPPNFKSVAATPRWDSPQDMDLIMTDVQLNPDDAPPPYPAIHGPETEPDTETWKETNPLVTVWLTDLEMDPLSNPLFQSTTTAVAPRLDGIVLTSKAPSVISEPYWLAMSSTQSMWAAESSPSELGGHLDIRVPPGPSSIVSTPQLLRDDTKEFHGRKGEAKRKGPLTAGQRKQASEVRKLRACLRCRFLKKTCDKGQPCAGCQPSYARLWQVPCTRIDIKDLDYFMKDWKADYERQSNIGFAVNNIKGFEEEERDSLFTYGQSHSLPLKTRNVHIHDSSYLEVEWTESLHGMAARFTVPTEPLSCGMEGVSKYSVHNFIDLHVESGFERLVEDYFQEMPFNLQLVKSVHRFYLRDRTPTIRNSLKMITGYILTHHILMVDGQHESMAGCVEDPLSKHYGRTMAPAMVNFQVTCAMADAWRELCILLLADLSAYYSGVYSGDKLRNWGSIFALSTILLILWEQMQFDSFFHTEIETEASHFCKEMEATPVGVVIGLYHAITQKLPSFTEWNTTKHHHLLNSYPPASDMMTEVQDVINANRSYLVDRSQRAEFDNRDFGSLAGKFISRLLIRGGVNRLSSTTTKHAREFAEPVNLK